MINLSQVLRGIPTKLSHLDALGQKLIPQNINYDTPEYRDREYLQRRTMIAELSKLHKMGQPIREVEYTAV